MLRPGEIVIHEGNWRQEAEPVVDNVKVRRGLIPRNYKTHPSGCYGEAAALDMPLIPQSEWSDRLKVKVAEHSLLSDIRLTGNNGQSIPSRDQNGKGYCWAHSGVSAMLVLRAAMGLPYVSLSAYAIACTIKNYADEGGWGAESMDFLTARGCPTDKFWPQQSMSRANDKPETWANAALHKVTEGFIDLAAAQYDRKLTFAQMATCLLSDIPVQVDYNFWSHSVCAIDLVDGATAFSAMRADSGKKMRRHEFEAAWNMSDPVMGGMGVRIWNSWADVWSDRGMGVLAPDKATPDGASAPRAATASAA